MIKRTNKPFKNQWSLPGGKFEENETLIESAKREIKEELGFTPNKLNLLTFFEFQEPCRAIIFAYQTQYNGNIISNLKEVYSYAWVNMENIDSFEPFPPNRRTVIEYLKEKATS